jgi:hypothetical protein
VAENGDFFTAVDIVGVERYRSVHVGSHKQPQPFALDLGENACVRVIHSVNSD